MIVAVTLIACFFPFLVAHAYLDPGSGSFIIQLIIGAFLGSIVAIKMYFKNIKKSLSKIFQKEKATGKTESKNENDEE